MKNNKILKFHIIFYLLIYFSVFQAFGDISEDITKKCSISSDVNISSILDGRYSTGIDLHEGSYVSINLNDKSNIKSNGINSIYILWDNPPDSFLVKDENDSVIKSYINDDIFFHQLIKFNSSLDTINIIFNGSDCKIAEIYVFGGGNLPEWVQDWQKPYKKADMLLLSTHADDEHLFFGGAMPYYAGELKMKVQVAYLTNHYNYRIHELLNGLWTVGIQAYPIISDFYDYYASSLEQAKQLYDENAVLEFQVELLRRFKPDVVLGHDLNGEYGHGVHMLNAASLTNAIQMSSDASMFEKSAQKYGVWDVPKCYLHLYKENKLSMNWDIPLSKFSNKTAFEMAVLGFSKHISQTEFFSVGKKGVFDCRAFGLYRSVVGYDTVKNDFFENLNTKPLHTDKFSISVVR